MGMQKYQMGWKTGLRQANVCLGDIESVRGQSMIQVAGQATVCLLVLPALSSFKLAGSGLCR